MVEAERPGFGLFNPDDSGVIAAVVAEEEEDSQGQPAIEGGLEELSVAENFVCTGPGTFRSTKSCSKYFTCTPGGEVLINERNFQKYLSFNSI